MNVRQSSETRPPEIGGSTRVARGGAGTQGGALSRSIWSFLFIVPVAVLTTAALLAPDPAGHGTHTQLGLPPCGFLVATGLPGPGCGLTTSFAHMIRLDFVGAARANPTGIVLFLLTAACIPLSLAGLIRRWSVIRTLDRLHFEKIAIAVAFVALCVWGFRVVPMLL